MNISLKDKPCLKALILAGGNGKRLKDNTADSNKCMLKFGGKYLIQYSLDNAVKLDVTEIVIVVGYLAEQIINEFGNCYSGKKINRKSNGRSSGTTNLYFENGDQSFDQLINSEKKLLYIKETIGRGANIITGDYSVGASGIMIENGKFTFPVSEITIAGNFNEMFKNIILADDLEFKYSTSSPTMLVNGITVGGK